VADAVRQAFSANGGHFLTGPESDAVARALVTPQRLPSPTLVGRSALEVAEKAGISVPPNTRVLIAPLVGVGRDFPLSIEKLCPVLSYYVVKDWREGCERCMQILRYGGMGHTMSIHSRNEQVILEFGLKKPAFRICVNTPTTLGSIGLTTGLDPAMTLGCGGYGGNITSDNITPRHLLNIKRLAYETSPADIPGERGVAMAPRLGVVPGLPKPPQRPPQEPVSAESLSSRIDQFLQARGIGGTTAAASEATPLIAPAPRPAGAVSPEPVPFVCEEDVRVAARANRKIVVDERTIITPAARDAGEALRIFEQAWWRP
jgi:acetaldehyde dehydrogenase (acetylating)